MRSRAFALGLALASSWMLTANSTNTKKSKPEPKEPEYKLDYKSDRHRAVEIDDPHGKRDRAEQKRQRKIEKRTNGEQNDK